MENVSRRPSVGTVVGVIALVLAMSGGAIAAQDGLSKKQVTKIAKKQAKKQLKKNVAGSHVNLADRATNADRADAAGTVDDGAVTAAKLGTIVERSESTSIANNTGDTASVQCEAGELRISGGTDTTGVGTDAGWSLIRSGPNGNGWGAAARNQTGNPGTLIVEVLCLQP